jgi:predicted Co/Zn/Cd cation transporter (cation efflux family)
VNGHDHSTHGEPGSTPAPAVHLLPGERAAALVRARRLNRLTLSWNIVEGLVAIGFGLAAGSVSLIGFGMDSGIEVSAAVILAWRLRQERKRGCMAAYDRRATRLIGLAFVALAVYVWVQSVIDLTTGSRPEASWPGLVVALISFLVMPRVARAKRALAPTLGSQAVVADADQTGLCGLLSGVLVFGVGLNALFGWWWADPVAALAIGVLALAAGRRAWSAESLADTCCG